MSTPTYTPLAEVTLGSSASSVTFSSIPATYRDLVIVVESLANVNPIVAALRFNSDSGANYSFVSVYGTGASNGSSASTASILRMAQFASATTTNKSISIANIMDYSATDKHKSVISRTSQSSEATEAFASRWANTSAISSITVLTSNSANIFGSGSTFALYGIAA